LPIALAAIRSEAELRSLHARPAEIAGGVSTILQYRRADPIDDLHFAAASVVLGRGEAMSVGEAVDTAGVVARVDTVLTEGITY